MNLSVDSARANASLEFCLRLNRAYATLTRKLDNRLSALHGLSFGDFLILYHLQAAPNGRLRRIDLAERLGVTASGVTRTLLPLEKTGWVARQSDAKDARVSYASLTEAGQQLLAYALASVEPLVQDLTAPISDKQMQMLLPLLGQLAGMDGSNS
jgi:DNA-binding MarR family transcriptional regulator